MVNLGELAVAQGSSGTRRGMARVQLDGDVEDGRNRAFGRAGRAKDEADFEGGLRREQLRREVLVALYGLVDCNYEMCCANIQSGRFPCRIPSESEGMAPPALKLP